jgi:glycosyltransferase involved in cell wall biosynthesis
MTVLVSENTGAGDVAEDGVEGFVVPIRSSEAIAEKLEILILEPERRQSMREAALKKARTRQWDVYREELANAVGPMVEGNS